jgi:hypothetical protein
MGLRQLRDLIKNLQTIQVDAIVEESLIEAAPDVEQFQKNQWEQGEDSNGSEIRWQKDSHYPYSKSYSRRKSALGGQVDRVDLKLTGNFYNRVESKVVDGKLVIESIDEKAKYLEKNYGLDLIYGLNTQQKSKLIKEILRPLVLSKLRTYIFSNGQ